MPFALPWQYSFENDIEKALGPIIPNKNSNSLYQWNDKSCYGQLRQEFYTCSLLDNIFRT